MSRFVTNLDFSLRYRFVTYVNALQHINDEVHCRNLTLYRVAQENPPHMKGKVAGGNGEGCFYWGTLYVKALAKVLYTFK